MNHLGKMFFKVFFLALRKDLLFVTIVFFVGASALPTMGGTIYVDDDAPPEWYDSSHVLTIQEGINAASVDDTVFVHNGTYYDNFLVDKRVALIGEDRDHTILDGQNDKTITAVVADSVTIIGFSIQNAQAGSYAVEVCSDFNTISGNNISNNEVWAVMLLECNGNTVSHNIMISNGCSVYIRDASGNTISNNYVENSSVRLEFGSTGNVVSDNTFIEGNSHSILLSYSTGNIVSRNNIRSGLNGYGIYVQLGSNDNTITDNTIASLTIGGCAMYFDGSSNNTLTNNDISDHVNGIHIVGGKDNVITLCHLNQNYKGVRAGNADSNVIRWSEFQNNTNYAIELIGSSNTDIYGNNFIGNNGATSEYDQAHIQAYDDSAGANFWNRNYPLGGNYWSDYEGGDALCGPDQNVVGSDGIGDTPYLLRPLNVGNEDKYPLITPWPRVCGDSNDDGLVTVLDAVYLIGYLLKSGPEPIPHWCVGNANGDMKTNIEDIMFLIDYVFRNGTAPMPGCCESLM